MAQQLKNSTAKSSKMATIVRLKPRFMSNEEIVSGLKLRDTTAAEALVERYGVSIDRRVWRLLGADSEHHDVVQQVYTQILESIGQLREPDALTDWITSLIVNVVRRELRRRKYRRIVKLDDAPAHRLPDSTDTEDRYRLLRAYKILDAMKADHRIVFALRFIEGATLPEVAGAVNCSLATVKRRINKARNIFLSEAVRDPFLSSLVEEGAGDDG